MMLRLSLWLSLVVASSVCAEQEVYVSAAATGGGDGTRAQPFQTLTQARDALRVARQAGKLKAGETVTVQIAPGVYPQITAFELKAADGCTTYRAEKVGTVRLQGGVALEAAAFKPVTEAAVLARLDAAVRGKVLVCDVAGKLPGACEPFKKSFHGVPAAPWLYVNHQPMTLARWPNVDATNGGWAGFSKAVDSGLPKADAADPVLRKAHPGSFVFDDPRPARWNVSEGVWLLGYWTHDWSDEVIRIAAYDKEKKVISLAAPHSYGISGHTWGAGKRRFFALNALEELDAPGEWYLDRVHKLLYFYPAADLAQAEIVLATLTEALVKLNGAQHVKFEGLVFEYGHGEGLSAHGVGHMEILGCTVANLAGGGISIDGASNTVRSCDLFNLGKSGINLQGGDRKSLTPAGNRAENNHIHHYGLFQRTYAPGIGVGGCGQIVRHNCIHDAPHNAILYGGNEHIFELNEIYRVVLETGDAGAFYTGRDWTSQGNILRHNYIHDLGGGDAKHVNTMGVYLDDCDCGDSIIGNIFYRAGRAIMIGGGRDNPVLNNLVIDCPIGLHIDARGMTWKQWNSATDTSWSLEAKAQRLNYTQPPWSTKYPRLAAIMSEEPRQPLGNTVRRNVFVDCSRQVCDFDGNVKKLIEKLDIADNLAVNSTGTTNGMAKAVTFKGFANLAGTPAQPVDLGFANVATQDFSLRGPARLLKEVPSFEPIPFENIGLSKDEHRHSLPAR